MNKFGLLYFKKSFCPQITQIDTDEEISFSLRQVTARKDVRPAADIGGRPQLNPFGCPDNLSGIAALPCRRLIPFPLGLIPKGKRITLSSFSLSVSIGVHLWTTKVSFILIHERDLEEVLSTDNTD